MQSAPTEIELKGYRASLPLSSVSAAPVGAQQPVSVYVPSQWGWAWDLRGRQARPGSPGIAAGASGPARPAPGRSPICMLGQPMRRVRRFPRLLAIPGQCDQVVILSRSPYLAPALCLGLYGSLVQTCYRHRFWPRTCSSQMDSLNTLSPQKGGAPLRCCCAHFGLSQT